MAMMLRKDLVNLFLSDGSCILSDLLFVVTIKNEKTVEMVLNSTCESSCFLVTKIFNNFGVLLAAIRDCMDKYYGNSRCKLVVLCVYRAG